MAKSPNKQVATHITFDYSRPCATFGFFNSFNIEKIAGQALLEFALLNGRSSLFSFRCLLLKDAWTQGRDSMLEFLATIPESASPMTECEAIPPASSRECIMASNIMSVTRFGDMGEIRFGQFPFGLLVERSRKPVGNKAEVLADPLAVLLCDVQLMRFFLSSVFIDFSLK